MSANVALDRDDQLPNRRQLGTEWLSQIREALDRKGWMLIVDRGPPKS
jgi:hypothetical protein